MTDCSKCLRTDVKCCFTCKKDADKCKVWHHCGSDCPAHESRIKTNADRIRAMSDEELADFIEMKQFFALANNGTDGEEYTLNWLQSEAK